MKITTDKIEKTKSEVGYECDVCHKKVVYKLDFLPQKNTIIWSHPSGGWGESTETECIDICSLECLLKALRGVYFGADIHLSYDFLELLRQ